MDKKNMYPEMPMNPDSMSGVPPSYNQTFPTASSAVMAGRITSSVVQPQPPTFPPQQQQQEQSFVQPQVFVQSFPPIPPLGPLPCLVTCPSCHEQLMSNTVVETTMKTHMFALVLCLVGCFCCSCIPYCMDSCQNVNHYCKHCNAYLGVYNNNK